MTRTELVAEVEGVVHRLERLQAEVRTADVPFSPVETALIEARVGARRVLEALDAAKADVPDSTASDEAAASAMIDAPVSDSGAYPPACRECGDFELCVHDVGEEG